MVCLRKLLPEQMHRVIQIDAQQFLTNSECRIVSVKPDVVVPIASSATFRIDFLGNENDRLSVKWPGEMPNKWPDLLLKIIKAVDEERFTDLVLNKQTRVLVEEWKNKVICLKTGEKVKVDQTHLETVIPALDKPVLVVNEAYRGQEAILKKLDEKNFCVTIEIARGPLKGRIVEGVKYEDIK